jgi:hypothetical protein
MPDDVKTNNPNEVDSKKAQALAKLQLLQAAHKDKVSVAAFQGMEESINEYFDKEKQYSEMGYKRGGNPLDYYKLKTEKGNVGTNTKEIYDVNEALSSNVTQKQMYKMFAPQVVDNILQDKPVIFPEVWDIAAHYKDASQAGLHALGGINTNTLVIGELQDSNNAFLNSMADRIDLIANNSTSEDIGNMFSIDNQAKYRNTLSDAEYTNYALNGKIMPAEKNAAVAFNTLLQKATGKGKLLGGDIYADEQGNVQSGVKFEPMESRVKNKDAYTVGQNVIKNLDLSQPVNEQVKKLYEQTYKEKDRKDEVFTSFSEGIYGKLAEQNENIIRIKDVPQRIKKGSVSQLYKGILDKQKMQASTIGSNMSDNSMTVETKQLFDRFKYLTNVVGDPYGVDDQIGRLWIPN